MKIEVLHKDIVDYIRRHPDCTLQQIEDAFIGYQSQYESISSAIETLLLRDEIALKGGGHYVR